MADDAQLLVTLEARIRDFERNMLRANRVASQNLSSIEQRGRTAARNLEKSFADSGNVIASGMAKIGSAAAARVGSAFAAIGAGLALNELRKTADSYTKIMNSLKVAGVKDADLGGTFDKLFTSAQRNAAPLDALATLFGRVSAAQTTLKASSQDVMRVTDIVAQSLRVGGTSATEAQGALLQLGQALSGGKVQAEEYNSLVDGMRPLLQAAASGMQEAGGDVAKLTALVKDGKISSEAFFRAIIAGAPILEDQLAGSVTTSEQAPQRLQNEFIKAVGEFDKATGASAALAGAIDGLAGSIGGIGSAATSAVTGVQALINKVGELAQAHAGAQRAAALTYQNEKAARVAQAREMGLANSGGREKLAQERAAADAAASAASRQAVSGFRQSEIDFSNRQVSAPLPPSRPGDINKPKVNPIRAADYPVTGSGSGGSGGGGGGGAGGGSESRFDRDLSAIQRRTEALQLEAQMVGKNRSEVEKSRIALQLEQAAKRDGLAVTDDMRTKIDQAAQGYANAKMKVEDLKNALDGVKQAQQFVGQEIVDGFTDMIIEGKSATEVVQGLAKALLKAAIQGALLGSGPFGKLFGGGSGGGIFGLIGGLFMADGGYVSGPGTSRSDSIPAMLSNGEYVVNARATAENRPLLEALNTGRIPAFADGGFVGPSPNFDLPTIPARNPGGFSYSAQQAVNQSVTVNVQGGSSGNAKQDAAFADAIGKRVKNEMRALIGDEIAQQMRPNGPLREAMR